MPHPPEAYRALAERAWAWVQAQVRTDDGGLWLPENAAQTEPGDDPCGMYFGVGGLAYVLAEVRLARDLTEAEQTLADGIGVTLARRIPAEPDFDLFAGLVAILGVVTSLSEPGADLAVARLRELATVDGWHPTWMGPPYAVPEGRCNDATIGNAAVLLGALWALRDNVPGAAELAEVAVDIVMAERIETPAGLDWAFVPERFELEGPGVRMPNWSHGLAGIAGSLAAAGAALSRPELVDAARQGAEHLVTLGDTSDDGFRLPHVMPGEEGRDTFTYTWCHGPAGTSLLFAALQHAGVHSVAGRTPYDWERACLHSLKVSGIPERLRPGFWDNDGRCCGTAGVGDVVLNVWQRHGVDDDLDFALTLADALVERSINDGDYTYWRFVEHRNDDPLLLPSPSWMQGVAGIAAYLFRLARLLEQGRSAATCPRMDTWWALPNGG